MVQKEVAVKFSAEPGQKEFSALGVLAQTAGRGSICFDVPPEAFVPPPKVTSSVLRIIKERTLRITSYNVCYTKLLRVEPLYRKEIVYGVFGVARSEVLGELFARL